MAAFSGGWRPSAAGRRWTADVGRRWTQHIGRGWTRVAWLRPLRVGLGVGLGVVLGVGLGVGLGALAGCSGPARTLDPPTTLTVLAAASLREPVEAIAMAYQQASGVRILASTDASATLRTQIALGAPADVFLSADTENPAALASEGLVDGDVVAFAGNRLALVVPAGNPAALRSPADLATPGVTIIAAGDAVPITGYASQLLERLATLPGYPPDLPAAYAANVATREDNVRSVLAKIELGEGDAAIVYATDAAGSDSVDMVEIPAAANVTVAYAGAVISTSPNRAAGHGFLTWLTGTEAQAILASFGFVAAP